MHGYCIYQLIADLKPTNIIYKKNQPICMIIHTEAFACRWRCGSIGGGAPICLSWFVIQNQVLQFTSNWRLRSKLLTKIKFLNIFNSIYAKLTNLIVTELSNRFKSLEVNYIVLFINLKNFESIWKFKSIWNC